MSDDNNNQVTNEEVKPVEDSSIPAKVYELAKTDMLKYKDEVKTLKQQLAQIQADKEAEKKSELLASKKYEELFKQSEEAKNKLAKQLEESTSKFIDGHKIKSVEVALGGFKKPEYARFINKDAIQINEEGTVDHASVEMEVARLKKEYGELIKTPSVQSLPNQAPIGVQPRELKDMSEFERDELRRSLLKQK